ncbi:hypothetical protein DFP72DRAFT_1060457 [Ephemerocybe angulata]|uniref:Uncharacterized protein n=1 Tax=Ephemerocybe angulata TaxID=980116 RepID=A0A8H6IFC1_9AGAR|nr:hypothetical protein DFP72DRAFT_1060457 [Tulosesus angulatus]
MAPGTRSSPRKPASEPQNKAAPKKKNAREATKPKPAPRKRKEKSTNPTPQAAADTAGPHPLSQAPTDVAGSPFPQPGPPVQLNMQHYINSGPPGPTQMQMQMFPPMNLNTVAPGAYYPTQGQGQHQYGPNNVSYAPHQPYYAHCKHSWYCIHDLAINPVNKVMNMSSNGQWMPGAPGPTGTTPRTVAAKATAPSPQPTAAFGIDPALLKEGPPPAPQPLATAPLDKDNVDNAPLVSPDSQPIPSGEGLELGGETGGSAPGNDQDEDAIQGTNNEDIQESDKDDMNLVQDEGESDGSAVDGAKVIIGRHVSGSNAKYGWINGAGCGNSSVDIARTYEPEKPYPTVDLATRAFKRMAYSVLSKTELVAVRTGSWAYVAIHNPGSTSSFFHYSSPRFRRDHPAGLAVVHKAVSDAMRAMVRGNTRVRTEEADAEQKKLEEALAEKNTALAKMEAQLQSMQSQLDEARKVTPVDELKGLIAAIQNSNNPAAIAILDSLVSMTTLPPGVARYIACASIKGRASVARVGPTVDERIAPPFSRTLLSGERFSQTTMAKLKGTTQLEQLASVCVDAQLLEQKRERSRESSRKAYYKELAAARMRKIRAQKATGHTRKKRINVSQEERAEQRRERSRISSRKHYYKNLSESRKKATARSKRFREKRRSEIPTDGAPTPMGRQVRQRLEEPSQERSPTLSLPRVLTKRRQAKQITTPSPLPSSLPPSSDLTPTFRHLSLPDPDVTPSGSSQASSPTSLPSLTPFPQPGTRRLPRLPPFGEPVPEKTRRVLDGLSDEQRKFLKDVKWDASSLVESRGGITWGAAWDAAYKKQELLWDARHGYSVSYNI